MRFALQAFLITVCGTAVAAPGDVSFELLDRGDAVEVIAHNVKASRTQVSPIRQRLEVTVVGRPSAPSKVPADATVKVIEFDLGVEPRVLSVKLGFERADVKALARFAQAIQVGDDLHLLFPRKLPAEGVIPKLPDPTLPAIVKPVELPKAVPPAVKPEAKSDAKIETKPETKIDAKIEAKPEAKIDAKPEGAAEIDAKTEPKAAPLAAKAEPKAAATLAPAAEDDSWTKLSTFGAIGLAAAGIGAWLLKKRRTAQPQASTIEIIATRGLGGKAKIVWFSAGGRDMVVSVTPNQVRMLGQWQRKAGQVAAHQTVAPPQSLPEATALPEIRAPRITASSAAVAGILRLRAQTAQMTAQPDPFKVSDEVATGDVEADEVWARELLAASGSRR
jgi:flagellar biogenesis protein FliO